jgi:hypothetical protein
MGDREAETSKVSTKQPTSESSALRNSHFNGAPVDGMGKVGNDPKLSFRPKFLLFSSPVSLEKVKNKRTLS